MASHILSSSVSIHFVSFLPSAMARGAAGPSTVAVRVASGQRVPPSQDLVAAEPATRGRGRGRGRGHRGAQGRGGWGGAPASPPPAMPPPMEGHVGDQPREFFIRLPATASPPPSPYPICSGDGARSTPDPQVTHEGLREWRHTGRH